MASVLPGDAPDIGNHNYALVATCFLTVCVCLRQALRGVGQCSLAEFWVSKERANELNMDPALVRKVVDVVAQLYGCLVRTKCRYGIVTTYHMTWCVSGE